VAVIILHSNGSLVKIFIVPFTAHKSKHVRLPSSYNFVSEQVTPPNITKVTRVNTTLINSSLSLPPKTASFRGNITG